MKTNTNNKVIYKDLKDNIVRSCKQTKEFSMEFRINFEKLATLVSDMSLIPIEPVGGTAKRVKPENIPYLSEYFEKSYLSWFDDSKYFTALTFIDSDSIDEKATHLLNKLKQDQADDPDNDKVKDMATLVAEYPCYFATVVSYQNNDPSRLGKATYEIVCRANKVVIKSSDYQYDPVDFT
jgi:hypothetical protein